MQGVKYALLTLLHEEARHGYELKGAFEELLGGSWPLNVGQVYSTLARLERDGLVESEVVPQDPLPDRRVYSITATGRDELERWLAEPSESAGRIRDELFLKVLFWARLDGGDPSPVVAGHRQRYLQTLADLASIRSDDALPHEARLLVDGVMLHIEADLRWLDLCEERLQRRTR